ncbi:uncharacterized protein Pyn_25254 [Prunus yedoensis var. nudiflora]|uniref:Uncharacterized protein n=1 Tax=Prunus yedoensis var. nudiflora TaxID=2094558 RepID=A0A314Y7R5_PRUYE|nr:uncharacterized protein Pyn_25254 [Prunus yedoensis var. nudiflora]
MAGSEATPQEKRTKKNKKRKQRSLGESERPSKTHRIRVSEKESEPPEVEVKRAEKAQLREPNQELEQGGPWRNLELILSIQNKELDLQKKVELAYGFVISGVKEEGSKSDQDNQAVNMSRLIIFVNDWIQSLLISSGKKIQSGGEMHQAEVIETYLDFRCWEIFKFCLEESLKLNVSLSFSRNLLRSICLIARNALSLLNKTPSHQTDLFSIGEGLQLYNTVLDCISLVFSSHGGLSNENLDLWVSTVGAVLDLVHTFYMENLVSGSEGDFVFRFLCLVLEPFAKFFRAHPARKNGFRDFIDKLLEPLLHLLGLLHLQIGVSNPGRARNLLKLVEEVLSHGLYHPVHIDGFLNLCSSERYSNLQLWEVKRLKNNVKSYHRHLFDKMEKILAAKNALAVESMGELFRLLIDQVQKLKRASVPAENTKMMGKTEASKQIEHNLMGHTSKMSSGSSTALVEKNYCSTSFNAETRKSLLDFFVLIMEPLLLEINGYLETKPKWDPYWYLLEIEYEVIENDLVTLWLLMLSYLAIGLSLMEVPDRCSLSFKITDIGCQLVILYSQLRQVNNTIFALCKAIRLLNSRNGDGKGFDNETAKNKNNLQIFGLSTHWVFVFFFRLYMSCRSLSRSAMSLMPPDLSRKMSAAMGDSFTSYSGSDWIDMTDWINGEYFSWIVQPSASLPVVIQSISNIYCKDSAADSSPLTYVMHAMAVRRLVDLNRHIKSFEYLMQNNENLVQVRLLDDAGLSRCL